MDFACKMSLASGKPPSMEARILANTLADLGRWRALSFGKDPA